MPLSRIWLAFGLASTATTLVSPTAQAQDLRVYTSVKTLSGPKMEVIGRSLTLFHAGSVYDYVEASREVTIYDPSGKSFTVLDEPRHIATVLTHDEIRHFLQLAEQEVGRILENPASSTSANEQAVLRLLMFQLTPEFQSDWNEKTGVLRMSHPACSYRVVTQTSPVGDDHVDRYCAFADWTARINSVLHPKAMLPSPRLALNEELRQRRVLPTSVELDAPAIGLKLRAEHEWAWQFSDNDRQLIQHWKETLAMPQVRRVSFRQFQQETLGRGSEVTRR